MIGDKFCSKPWFYKALISSKYKFTSNCEIPFRQLCLIVFHISSLTKIKHITNVTVESEIFTKGVIYDQCCHGIQSGAQCFSASIANLRCCLVPTGTVGMIFVCKMRTLRYKRSMFCQWHCRAACNSLIHSSLIWLYHESAVQRNIYGQWASLAANVTYWTVTFFHKWCTEDEEYTHRGVWYWHRTSWHLVTWGHLLNTYYNLFILLISSNCLYMRQWNVIFSCVW